MSKRTEIGYVVGGGLKANLNIRLTIPSQDVQEGSFVIINTGDWRFYGLVTDLQLGSTDPRFADERSGQRMPKNLSKLLHGQTLYTNLEVLPNLMFEVGPDYESDPSLSKAYAEWEASRAEERSPHPIAVKTVPNHHEPVYLANEGDIAEIFGKEDDEQNFTIGHTRDALAHPVRINLDRLVERSSGIFGATGTGKSFTTMMVLAGLMKRNKVSLLIFDMHNEYAFDIEDKSKRENIPGLKRKFPTTRIVGLGSGASALYRNQTPDINLEIGKSDIRIEDIELLYRELNLRDTTSTTLRALVRSFRENWFSEFMKLESMSKQAGDSGKYYPQGSIEGWAEENNIHVEAAKALHNRLKNKIDSLPYVVEEPASNAVDQIIDSLQNGQHIILSFGKHDRDLDYLLVSNLLTRKIRSKWEELKNLSNTTDAPEPKQLVIVVEEAHKILNKEIAVQTIFSTIARELRKYNVTLLIVDQRPSQIYDEVMSQLGTRISGWLGDDDDIRAVLSGLAGRETLKGMLARLQSGEDILLLGPWGVPMPLPIRSRRFNLTFWEELLGKKSGKKSEAEAKKELGF